jgi:predicted component of type VI protein secretion system
VKKIFSIVLVSALVITGVIASVSAANPTANDSKIDNLLNDPLVVSIAEKSDSPESLKANYDALSPSDQESLTKSISELYELIASDEDPDALFATLPQNIQNLLTMDIEGRSSTVE